MDPACLLVHIGRNVLPALLCADPHHAKSSDLQPPPYNSLEEVQRAGQRQQQCSPAHALTEVASVLCWGRTCSSSKQRLL